MLLSFISALIAIIFPIFLLPFSSLAYFSLAYIIKVSEFFGNLPFASLKIPIHLMPFVLLGIFFVYITVFVYLKVIRKKVEIEGKEDAVVPNPTSVDGDQRY